MAIKPSSTITSTIQVFLCTKTLITSLRQVISQSFKGRKNKPEQLACHLPPDLLLRFMRPHSENQVVIPGQATDLGHLSLWPLFGAWTTYVSSGCAAGGYHTLSSLTKVFPNSFSQTKLQIPINELFSDPRHMGPHDDKTIIQNFRWKNLGDKKKAPGDRALIGPLHLPCRRVKNPL